jgi:serine/threonine protein kinase
MCPSNVLLSRNCEVKVADFGVARALRDATSAHTRTVVGHVGYIAPEVAAGRPVDERADLFATAVILWELVAGRYLFLQDTEAATVLSLMTREIVPISQFRPDLDGGWDSFFARALERDPERRFESAREMAWALDALPGARVDGAAQRLGALIDALRASAARAETCEVLEPPTLEDATRAP